MEQRQVNDDNESTRSLAKIDYENASDEVLLEKWYEGDSLAFDEIYQRYYPISIAYCIKLCKNREDSKDLVQKTFTTIIYKVKTRKGTPINCFHTYFFKALSLNFYENQRKKQRRLEKSDSGAMIIGIQESSSFDKQIDDFIQENTLEEILILIDNFEQRNIFKQYLNGHTYDEIAQKNNLTKGQVRGLLYRTKKSFKTLKETILTIIDG